MRRSVLAFVVASIGLALLATFAPPYLRYVIERLAIAALFAVGFNLVFGLAGIASLGNAAFYGIGAYVAGIVGAQHGAPWYVVMPLAIAFGALLGLVFGIFTARTRGIYALLLTLTLAQSLWGLASQNVALTQGDTGITGIVRALPLSTTDPLFGASVVGIAAVGCALAWLVWESTYGLIIAATAINEVRARSLGLRVLAPRLVAFALSGGLCALAGVMSAQLRGSVSPSDIDWPTSAAVLIAALLGGSRTVFGPALGAFVLVAIETLVGDLTGRWQLILGLLMTGTAIALPRGLVPPRARPYRRVSMPVADVEFLVPIGPLLQIDRLSYELGGRALFSDFSLRVDAGERHALLGPNGVGKSTLFALIGGERFADSGTIRFAGSDIADRTPDARARLGIGRTYQFGSLFDTLSVWENLAIAHAAARSGGRSIVRPLVTDSALLGAVDRSLAHFDLRSLANAPVSSLPHGTRRRVEIAVAFATQPKLVLLDEPTAGLERSEISGVLDAIEALPRDVALLVIEHDPQVAARLCTTITRLGGPRVARPA